MENCLGGSLKPVFLIVFLILTACQTDIRPSTVTSQDYAACAGAFTTRADVTKLAVAHCAKYNKRAVFNGVARDWTCGFPQSSLDVADAHYSYLCKE